MDTTHFRLLGVPFAEIERAVDEFDKKPEPPDDTTDRPSRPQRPIGPDLSILDEPVDTAELVADVLSLVFNPFGIGRR